MQRCADDVRPALKGDKRALAPVDALIAVARELVAGEKADTRGLGDLISELSTGGTPKPRGVVLALQALATFAFALDEWGRGDPRGVVAEELQRARDLSAMAVVPTPRPPTIADVRARLTALAEDDLAGLAAIIDDVRDHRMRELVPLILERLPLDDSTQLASGAVRSLQRIYRPKDARFAELCTVQLTSPRAGTRRWAAYGLALSGAGSQYVAPLLPLLRDPEAHVRKEAATTLRIIAAGAPDQHEAIRAAVGDAPREPAILDLLRAVG